MACVIGLTRPKYQENVASVLRVAECFGVTAVIVSGLRYKRHGMDVFGSSARVPLINSDDLRAQIPFDHVPIAVEFTDTADSLPLFCHPRDAFYVFGPEDGSLGKKDLEWCHHVIRIPTIRCFNLGISVGVVMYDRSAKARKD